MICSPWSCPPGSGSRVALPQMNAALEAAASIDLTGLGALGTLDG